MGHYTLIRLCPNTALIAFLTALHTLLQYWPLTEEHMKIAQVTG